MMEGKGKKIPGDVPAPAIEQKEEMNLGNQKKRKEKKQERVTDQDPARQKLAPSSAKSVLA